MTTSSTTDVAVIKVVSDKNINVYYIMFILINILGGQSNFLAPKDDITVKRENSMHYLGKWLDISFYISSRE